MIAIFRMAGAIIYQTRLQRNLVSQAPACASGLARSLGTSEEKKR